MVSEVLGSKVRGWPISETLFMPSYEDNDSYNTAISLKKISNIPCDNELIPRYR